MKNIILSLLLMTSLFGQINNVLTISPTSGETTLGNQSLAYRNAARNHFNLDTTTNVSFTNVQWLTNIVDDMGYNYVDIKWKNLNFGLFHFNYGEQQEADIEGHVVGLFSPSSTILNAGWGTPLYYKGSKLDSASIGINGKIILHDLYTEETNGMLFDVGVHLERLYGKVDVDFMISNFGLMTKINGYDVDIPTSLNIGIMVPIKQWEVYNQWNIYNGYYTHGQGVLYNYKDMLWFKAGYFSDVDHQLNYPSVGIDFKYDKYKIGFGVLQGDETHPLKDSFLLTINVEI